MADDEKRRPRGAAWPRRRSLGAALILAALAALPLAGRPAVAQPAALGGGSGEWVARIRGVGGPVAPGSTFVVSAETADDTDFRLTDDISQALAARGYRVAADGAGLQLWYDTEMAAGTVGNDPGAATDTEIGDPAVQPEVLGEGSAIGAEGRDMPMPVPEATFGFGPGGRKWQGTPYSLTFTVGRPGEPPLWQGAVTTRIGAEDPYEVARAMVPLLVDQIGKTVRADRSFP